MLNIRGKLILSISLPLLATYLGLLAWDYYRQRTAATQQMQQTVLERAEAAAAQVDARVSSVMQTAAAGGTLLENPDGRDDQRVRGILQGATRNPWVASAHITVQSRGSGSAIALTSHRGPRRGAMVSADAVSPAAVPAQATWSEPRSEKEPDGVATRRVSTYSVPIVDSADRAVGVVSLTVRLDELRQLRGRPPGPREFGRRNWNATTSPATTEPGEGLMLPPPPPGEFVPEARGASDSERRIEDFAIFDSAGRVIVAAKSAATEGPPDVTFFKVAEELRQPEMADAAREAVKGQARVIRVTGLHDAIPLVPEDSHHWLAIAPIHSTGWFLVSAIPESSTMAPLLKRLWQRAAFLGAGLLVLLAVVLVVSLRISRPIERLAGAVDRLAAGELDTKVAKAGRSRDELARLADGFNAMTNQLKAHVAALTEQTAAREKVESEIRIARQIQNDLLPKTFPPFPDRHEFDLHAMNVPARRVAGDFYDFFFMPGRDLLTIVVADVSGKGVPAAMLMAVTRTIVRNLAHSGLSPVEIARRANILLLADTSPAMFVTMILCQYEPATGRLTYVNAGHPPPLRLRYDRPPVPCCSSLSPLLGVAEESEIGPFQQFEEQLSRGETLLLFTDGVTESPTPGGSLLGQAGLIELLGPHTADRPPELCAAVASAIDGLQGGNRQDDVTLLALRRASA